MNIVSNICLLLVVVLQWHWHWLPSQALNNIGNHPDCGLQPDDPNTESSSQESKESEQFPEFGGRYTTPFKYPWMAKLNYEPFYEIEVASLERKRILKFKLDLNSSCSATILNERWVLTAAHCFHERSEQNYRLRKTEDFLLYAGRFDFSQDADESDTEQERELERTILHPQYDPRDYIFDVALIKLKTPPLRFGAQHKVGAICLPTNPNVNLAGVWLKVLGWGYRDYDDATCPLSKRKLREVTSRVWSYQECKLAHKGLPWLQLYELLGPIWLEMRKHDLSGSYSSGSDSDSAKDNSAPSSVISLDNRAKRTICLGQKGKESLCGGDSGGAMVAWDPKMTGALSDNNQGRWVQYGVNSWIYPVNNTKEGEWRSPSYVSVGMRVSKFTSWIWATVNEYSTESDGITIPAEPVRTVENPPPRPNKCKPMKSSFKGQLISYFEKPFIIYKKNKPSGRSNKEKPTCVMP